MTEINPSDVLAQLNAAAVALDAASTKLVKLARDYEGHVDEHGEYQPGPQLLWLEAVGDELDKLAQEYEGTRAPNIKVLEGRAERRAKARHPDLWADYHRLRSEVASLQRWISAKKETISARQSVLKAETQLAGSPPQWSRAAA